MFHRIPCVLMRAGTSRGPYLLAADLPTDPARRDAVLLRIMGSPDPLQLDGLGGANPSPARSQSSAPRISPARTWITCSHSEGQRGERRHKAELREHALRRRPVRDRSRPGRSTRSGDARPNLQRQYRDARRGRGADAGRPGEYEGDTRIDGVDEAAAPVKLTFLNAIGAITGRLLPTGRVLDVIDGVEASCVDIAMPVVIMAAEAFGKSGRETPAEPEADRELFRGSRRSAASGPPDGARRRFTHGRAKAGARFAPREPGGIASRYFTPHACHRCHAATGALAVGTAASMPGSVASRYVSPDGSAGGALRIEHPAGRHPGGSRDERRPRSAARVPGPHRPPNFRRQRPRTGVACSDRQLSFQ